jgi:Tyrosine-protein kinase ephrin type A/B receptor-like
VPVFNVHVRSILFIQLPVTITTNSQCIFARFFWSKTVGKYSDSTTLVKATDQDYNLPTVYDQKNYYSVPLTRDTLPCLTCPPTTYATAVGSTACTQCNPGYYASNQQTGACTQCAAGKYSSNSDVSGCALCPAGSYSSTGAAICTSCPVGKSGPSGSNNVNLCTTTCASGFYSATDSKTGGQVCTICPIGTYSAGGVGSCTQCPAGYTTAAAGADSQAKCVQCAAGQYYTTSVSNGVTSYVCANCPQGTYR